jgi:hypothetical protein
MAKKPFYLLILELIEKKIPMVRSSQGEEDEIIMLCDILAEAEIPPLIRVMIALQLRNFSELLSSHDEQKTKAYLLQTMEKVTTN